MKKGQLYLIPNTLGSGNLSEVIPEIVQDIASKLRIFAVENVKNSRRYLRKIDSEFPINNTVFFELNKRTTQQDIMNVLLHLNDGNDIGLMSDAGCPGIADPGSKLIALAHQNNIRVVPLAGPSSIFMSIMASGFSGQTFTFHGYIPKDRKERVERIKRMEKDARNFGSSQVFIETPYRNNHVLEDLLKHLKPDTLLSISSEITCENEFIKSASVSDWKKIHVNFDKRPTVFIIGCLE